MSREKAAMLTQTEHPKARFRAVFVSLHGDAKRYPGGVTALAHELGMIPAVLADKLSPNIFDKVPTVRELLEVFERTHSVPTANALALLLDRTTVPVAVAHQAPRDVAVSFLGLVKQAGAATAMGADALVDGALDADERAAMGSLLDDLISAAVSFRALVRSGCSGG